MANLKRKSKTKLDDSPKKKSLKKMDSDSDESISPASKITIFKLDVVSCNGRDLCSVELGASDLEKIWTDSIIRELSDLTGYTSLKVKSGTEIRIQYQLRKPMSIKDIALESEFLHEREGPRGTEILKCKVVGLNSLRATDIGEKVKATVIAPNFDITPDQIINWLTRYGKIQEGHR